MKTLYAFMLFLFTWTCAQSQGFSVEALGGPAMLMGGDFKMENPTDSNSTVAFDKDATIGFAAGISGAYYFNENIGLSLGLQYATQGQKYKDYHFFSYVTYTKETSLSYLRLPLMLNYVTSNQYLLSFRAQAGLYAGMLLNYTDESSFTVFNGEAGSVNAEGETATTQYVSPIEPLLSFTDKGKFSKKPFKSTDFGVTAGVGLHINVSDAIEVPVLFTINMGLADVKEKASAFRYAGGQGDEVLYWQTISSTPEHTQFRNMSFAVMAGVKYNFDIMNQ
jgi:hypothetical protein